MAASLSPSISPSVSPSISPSISPQDYGLRIAKSEHDITDAERYLIMTSKYPVLKLQSSDEGIMSFTAGDGGVTITIAHNLGYVPLCFVYGEYFDTPGEVVVNKFSKWNRWIYQGLQVADYYYYYADSTNLYIKFSASHLTDAYSFDLDYMYHIFYDEDEIA